MAETGLDRLRICAFCPNPCRAVIPEAECDQRESRTPSALAYLAVALGEGFVAAAPAVETALRDLKLAELCRPACVYGFDIPAEIRARLDGDAAAEGLRG
ncbi:hypothetical protein AY600_11570 [Phormidium willei BDU 130791]|nr:hypothetical protein AY600_11570 [Phormidium willei BDU 130791]